MSISDHECFERNPDVVTREIAGETLLVPVSGELANLADMFALNRPAALVWESMNPATSAGALRDALVERFDVGAEEAWQDLCELLDELVSTGLAQRATPSSPAA